MSNGWGEALVGKSWGWTKCHPLLDCFADHLRGPLRALLPLSPCPVWGWVSARSWDTLRSARRVCPHPPQEQVLPAQPSPAQLRAGSGSHREHRYGAVTGGVELGRGHKGQCSSFRMGFMGGDGDEGGPWALENLSE